MLPRSNPPELLELLEFPEDWELPVLSAVPAILSTAATIRAFLMSSHFR